MKITKEKIKNLFRANHLSKLLSTLDSTTKADSCKDPAECLVRIINSIEQKKYHNIVKEILKDQENLFYWFTFSFAFAKILGISLDESLKEFDLRNSDSNFFAEQAYHFFEIFLRIDNFTTSVANKLESFPDEFEVDVRKEFDLLTDLSSSKNSLPINQNTATKKTHKNKKIDEKAKKNHTEFFNSKDTGAIIPEKKQEEENIIKLLLSKSNELDGQNAEIKISPLLQFAQAASSAINFIFPGSKQASKNNNFSITGNQDKANNTNSPQVLDSQKETKFDYYKSLTKAEEEKAIKICKIDKDLPNNQETVKQLLEKELFTNLNYTYPEYEEFCSNILEAQNKVNTLTSVHMYAAFGAGMITSFFISYACNTIFGRNPEIIPTATIVQVEIVNPLPVAGAAAAIAVPLMETVAGDDALQFMQI